MEESFALKLIIEKGPREGETLEYSSRTVVKIGRIVRGNTIGIRDAGISSKHISIHFDNDSSNWNLTDLDSSNGTILNGETLSPNIPSVLNDGDCIKIGELTSIIVKIGGVQSTTVPQRNTRRQAKSAVIEKEQDGLGLGLDGDLGENVVQKRNLRPRAKKAADSKNEVDTLNTNKRILRSSKKEVNVSSISTLPEDTNSVVKETADQIVPIERKVTRGRTKKLQVRQLPDSDIGKPSDIVVAPAPVDGKKTRRGRKGLKVEPLEELQTGESVQVHVTVEPTLTQEVQDEDAGVPTLNAMESSVLDENLDAKNESIQDHVAEGSVKETSVDTSRWQDLEKMTLGDFFDYLEWYLPKEIRERTEEIISQLPEKTRKFHEVRLQGNGKDKGKQAMD